MLELKDLTKTYRPKKGVPVQAIKGVSLSFGEKGLVFVLGKSGSGKSTLLNLIGGLDFPDSGEIVIDGKSSNYFKSSDYDSYRNTYVGIAFQEYNLLDGFTVGENISLALELQRQKVDKQRLDDALKEVDLEGYADRKINELSGGQKQRVAIARALIKNPKILMADEPTGALDSSTGRAIFDTLKKISKEKLVIVVSHDREFAEEYGDRVIELADGEVIADTSQGKEAGELSKMADKVEMKKSRLPYARALKMGTKSMRVKPLRLIITILLCFVSFTFFGLLDVATNFDKVYSAQSALLLPNNDYVSFNASINYKSGIFDCNYNIYASYGDLAKLRESTGLDFQGVLGVNHESIPLWNRELLNKGSDREYYTGRWGGILTASQSLFDDQGYKLYGRLPENDGEIVITKYVFDQFAIAGIRLSDGGFIPSEEIGDIQGFLDKKPSVELESSLFNYVISYEFMTIGVIVGVVDTNTDVDGRIKKMNISDEYYYNQICRQYFYNGYHSLVYVHQSLYDYILNATPKPDTTGFGRTVKVSFDGKRFNGVATDKAFEYTDKIVWLDGKGERKELAENEIVIGISKAIDLWSDNSNVGKTLPCKYTKTHINGTMSFSEMTLSEFRDLGPDLILYCEEAEAISLEELEIYKQYCIDIGYVFENLGGSDHTYYKDYNYRRSTNPDTMTENDWRFSYACYLSSDDKVFDYGNGIRYEVEGGKNQNVTGRKCGKEINTREKCDRVFIENLIANHLNLITKKLPEDYEITYAGVSSRYYNDESQVTKFKDNPIIVGVYYPKEGYPDDFVINNLIYEKSFDYEELTYTYLIAPMPKDKKTAKKIVELHYDTSNIRGLVSNNVEFTAVDSVANPFLFNISIFRTAGIIVGVFSVLLLGNYIAISISAKKKEIGILRAIGARKSDILAIFINECVIITIMVLILSIIGLTIACSKYNADVTSLAVQLKVVHVGIRQIALMIALGVLVIILSSAIPLYRLSKKKPIDCIQDR